MPGSLKFLAATALATAIAAPASAQTFFSCLGNDGKGWGLYRVQGNSIAQWSAGTGWSGNLCNDRRCSVTANEISMHWKRVTTRGTYAYTEQTETLTVNRRSGTASRFIVTDQWAYNGEPYRPGNSPTYNPHREYTYAGSCQAASDPEAGPAKF